MGLTEASLNRIAFTSKEPIGVVVAVSAFNHPLNLAVHQIATAVAAGCPVIFKPASSTPLSGLALAAILKEAGLPECWLQVGEQLAPNRIFDETRQPCTTSGNDAEDTTRT